MPLTLPGAVQGSELSVQEFKDRRRLGMDGNSLEFGFREHASSPTDPLVRYRTPLSHSLVLNISILHKRDYTEKNITNQPQTLNQYQGAQDV